MFKLEDVSYFKLKIWIDSSEEDMSKVRIGQKLDFLCQTVSQVVNVKGKSKKLKVALHVTGERIHYEMNAFRKVCHLQEKKADLNQFLLHHFVLIWVCGMLDTSI